MKIFLKLVKILLVLKLCIIIFLLMIISSCFVNLSETNFELQNLNNKLSLLQCSSIPINQDEFVYDLLSNQKMKLEHNQYFKIIAIRYFPKNKKIRLIMYSNGVYYKDFDEMNELDVLLNKDLLFFSEYKNLFKDIQKNKFYLSDKIYSFVDNVDVIDLDLASLMCNTLSTRRDDYAFDIDSIDKIQIYTSTYISIFEFYHLNKTNKIRIFFFLLSDKNKFYYKDFDSINDLKDFIYIPIEVGN